MSRIISDETFARLVNHLAQNETVALFQQLLLSEKSTDESTTGRDTENQTGGNIL